jgi:hypothetical protein
MGSIVLKSVAGRHTWVRKVASLLQNLKKPKLDLRSYFHQNYKKANYFGLFWNIFKLDGAHRWTRLLKQQTSIVYR